MWEAVGADGGRKIAGSADDLHKLEFVPRTDRRWFDPNAPKYTRDQQALVDNKTTLNSAISEVNSIIGKLERAGTWGASTLRRDFDQLVANKDAVIAHYR